MDVIPQAYWLFIGLLVTDVIPEALLCAARRKNLFDHDFAAGAKNRNRAMHSASASGSACNNSRDGACCEEEEKGIAKGNTLSRHFVCVPV